MDNAVLHALQTVSVQSKILVKHAYQDIHSIQISKIVFNVLYRQALQIEDVWNVAHKLYKLLLFAQNVKPV